MTKQSELRKEAIACIFVALLDNTTLVAILAITLSITLVF
jgi:hypothetical protein